MEQHKNLRSSDTLTIKANNSSSSSSSSSRTRQKQHQCKVGSYNGTRRHKSYGMILVASKHVDKK